MRTDQELPYTDKGKMFTQLIPPNSLKIIPLTNRAYIKQGLETKLNKEKSYSLISLI